MLTVYNGNSQQFATDDSMPSQGDNDSDRMNSHRERDQNTPSLNSELKKARFQTKGSHFSQRSLSLKSDLNYSKRTSARRY
jgi:hypothetical protein